MTDDEPRPLPEVLARIGVSAVPYVGSPLLVLLDEVLTRRRAAASKLMSEITAVAGGQENLTLRLANPEIEALFIDGFETAMRTSITAKQKLLAEVIAQALLDDAKVDASQLYVMALRDLEAPHIRALARLARIVEELRSQLPSDVLQRPRFVDRANEQVRGVWNAEPAPVQAALVRTGCVQFSRGPVISSHKIDEHITDFGFGLLDDIERHGWTDQDGRGE
ncbi:hypothetical protein [Kocuria rosea]|uniref:hypothetical protein n=2 Tax=Kocuria rosea TaxID=1275 RepID=UPI00232E6786|nr:hypothetical protein [Kocuria rosea]